MQRKTDLYLSRFYNQFKPLCHVEPAYWHLAGGQRAAWQRWQGAEVVEKLFINIMALWQIDRKSPIAPKSHQKPPQFTHNQLYFVYYFRCVPSRAP
jgi:hypothetical protein